MKVAMVSNCTLLSNNTPVAICIAVISHKHCSYGLPSICVLLFVCFHSYSWMSVRAEAYLVNKALHASNRGLGI